MLVRFSSWPLLCWYLFFCFLWSELSNSDFGPLTKKKSVDPVIQNRVEVGPHPFNDLVISVFDQQLSSVVANECDRIRGVIQKLDVSSWLARKERQYQDSFKR